MSRKHYSPEQIIYKLREAEVLISQGMKTPEAARQVGIVEQTYYRWRKDCRNAYESSQTFKGD